VRLAKPPVPGTNFNDVIVGRTSERATGGLQMPTTDDGATRACQIVNDAEDLHWPDPEPLRQASAEEELYPINALLLVIGAAIKEYRASGSSQCRWSRAARLPLLRSPVRGCAMCDGIKSCVASI